VIDAARQRPTVFLVVALLAVLAAALSWQTAPSLARASRGACVTAAGNDAQHGGACAESARSTRDARAKVRRHHKKPGTRSKKKNGRTQHSSLAPNAASAPQPVSCEDGSTPARGAEGAYECADGSEPSCAHGIEPVSRGGAPPLCPVSTPPAAGSDRSEASCADGSTPTPSASGGYSCEDDSTPECEDGSHPTSAEQGSPPACFVPAGSSSAQAADGEEGDGFEEVADDSSARVAITS
jgi:hypothetical protein